MPRTIDPTALPSRIVDVLETDGGWLSLMTLAELLEAKPNSVTRACNRLKVRGLAESRKVEAGTVRTSVGSANGYMGNGGGNLTRLVTEWRVVKPCSKCGELKPLTEYHVHRGNDRMPSCRDCKSIDQKVTVGGWRGPSGRLRLPKDPQGRRLGFLDA